MADPQAVRAAWRDLGQQLATLRKAAKLSQHDLADRTEYSRSSIANIEIGLQHVNRIFWETIDDLLGAAGDLLRGYDAAETLQRAHRRPRPKISTAEVGVVGPSGVKTSPVPRLIMDRPGAAAEPFSGAAIAGRQEFNDVGSMDPPRLIRTGRSYDEIEVASGPDSLDRDEDIVDVLARIQNLSRAVDPVVICGLEKDLFTMLVEYETWERRRFARSLVKKRVFVEGLAVQSMQPGQRRRLFQIAGKISGLLGYVEVGREGFQLARAYCAESFRLAELAEDPDLQAWSRGMQSFCEYYAGDHEEALAIAVDGLSYARTGPQSVRLMINGVARAAGKLDDRAAVHRAVESAFNLMSQNEVPAGVPSSVSLECYSQAQTASNAVTAYVSLGAPARVQEFAALALPDIKKSASPWSQALLKIDLATSMTLSVNADLERASSIVIDALRISSGYPIVSIRRRVLEFLGSADRRWGKVSSLDEVKGVLEGWGKYC